MLSNGPSPKLPPVRCLGVEDAPERGVERGLERRVVVLEALPGRRGPRRNPAVGRIDQEPRAASSRDVERVAKLVRSDRRRTLEELLQPLRAQRGQLHVRDVLEAPPLELVRPFERGVRFVLVRVVALQVRIAPRRPGRGIRRGGRNHA